MSYTAVIRWRGPDPTIEIESLHPGFENPEEAALFANAIQDTSPCALHLDQSGLVLSLNNGTFTKLLNEQSKAMILSLANSQEEVHVAHDEDFEAFPIAVLEGYPSAFGKYEQAQYGVNGPDGSPLDVIVEFDEEQNLRVQVTEVKGQPGIMEYSPVLGVFPRA